MKKLSLLLAATLCCATLLAQKEKDSKEPAPLKNMVKLNLPALALKNISIQYERAVAAK